MEKKPLMESDFTAFAMKVRIYVSLFERSLMECITYSIVQFFAQEHCNKVMQKKRIINHRALMVIFSFNSVFVNFSPVLVYMRNDGNEPYALILSQAKLVAVKQV